MDNEYIKIRPLADDPYKHEINMDRAYSTLVIGAFIADGLKPIATKRFEPKALLKAYISYPTNRQTNQCNPFQIGEITYLNLSFKNLPV